MPKTNSQKGSVKVSTFAGMTIIAAVVVASAVAVIKYHETPNVTAPVSVITPKLSSIVAPVAGEITDWKTYRNDEYGFEVKYPKAWYAEEKKDGIPEFSLLKAELNSTKPNIGSMSSVFFDVRSRQYMLNSSWKNIEIGQIKGLMICGGRDICEYGDFCCKINLDLDPIKNLIAKTIFIYTLKSPLLDQTTNQILSTFKFTK